MIESLPATKTEFDEALRTLMLNSDDPEHGPRIQRVLRGLQESLEAAKALCLKYGLDPETPLELAYQRLSLLPDQDETIGESLKELSTRGCAVLDLAEELRAQAEWESTFIPAGTTIH